MPTAYSRSLSSRTELTPSTIQCTQFYTNDYKILTNQLKKLNQPFRRVPKSLSLPVLETVKSPLSPPLTDFPYASTALSLLNRYSQTMPCLDLELAQNIRMALPSRISVLSRWKLIYSLDQHGASLSTLYQQCRQTAGPCLLVIQDGQYEIFGVYLTEPLHTDSSYYGTGECFLWKQDKKTKNTQIYPWTTKNDYMICSNRQFLAMGGGQGQFGLYLHSDLTHGYTEPCETFDNPPLASSNSFECVGLEIWGFQY